MSGRDRLFDNYLNKSVGIVILGREADGIAGKQVGMVKSFTLRS